MNITSAQLNKIDSQYGPSFYLFESEQFENNLVRFWSEFRRVYPNVEIAYSFKTKYMPALCKIARSNGVLAEVVSGLEYDIAKKTGFKGDEIIFNGPVKEKEVLYDAFSDGAMVQFDSYEEVEILKKYLKEYPDKTVKCAVRVNFNIGEKNRSRFGFDVENGSAADVYAELFSLDGCTPAGIHCHFSTGHRSLESFKIRTEKLTQLSSALFEDQKHELEFINIGGGFFGDMPEQIKAQFTVHTPSYGEYAHVIGRVMKEAFPDGTVSLIIEPGAALAADTMSYFCRVQSIKRIAYQPVVTITGSIHNIRPTFTSTDIPFKIIKSSDQQEKLQHAVIGGYTCLENDIITSSFSGDLGVGDYLVFDNAGAYNIVFKPPFIKAAPPIVMVKMKNGSADFELIRKQETTDMILSPYLL